MAMDEDDDGDEKWATVGAWPKPLPLVRDASEEVMLLWAVQQPTTHPPNAFVHQAGLQFRIDACGQELAISQVPSSLGQVGVTGGVMWDSAVVLAKFLEHAADCGCLHFVGKKVVELGSGCGLVGCVSALLGAHAFLTDRPDRLKLLQKNARENGRGFKGGTAAVMAHEWGDEPDPALSQPPPDLVVASDVIYDEAVVPYFVSSLTALCGVHTTVFLTCELRNDVVLECFLQSALMDFVVGRVPIEDWHPTFGSSRIALFTLCRKFQTP